MAQLPSSGISRQRDIITSSTCCSASVRSIWLPARSSTSPSRRKLATSRRTGGSSSPPWGGTYAALPRRTSLMESKSFQLAGEPRAFVSIQALHLTAAADEAAPVQTAGSGKGQAGRGGRGGDVPFRGFFTFLELDAGRGLRTRCPEL